MIGSVDLMAAMAVWEYAAWHPLFPDFTSYQYFPNKIEWGTGLKYPYSCHQREMSDGTRLSINQMPTVEDQDDHKIWTYIIFNEAGAPLDQISRLDAEWADRYRLDFLLHLQLGISGGGGILKNVMGTIAPCAFSLFGRNEVGIQVPLYIGVRQSKPTGL